MTRFTHTVLLASAMTFGLAATAQAQMVDMAFEDLSVKGETLSVTKVGWQVEGETEVETKAGTVVTGDKAKMTDEGVKVKGEEVVVKTEDTITVAQDGEVMIKDNKIEVVGDKIGQQTTKAKEVVSSPENMVVDKAKDEMKSQMKNEAKKKVKAKAKTMMEGQTGTLTEIDTMAVKDRKQWTSQQMQAYRAKLKRFWCPVPKAQRLSQIARA